MQQQQTPRNLLRNLHIASFFLSKSLKTLLGDRHTPPEKSQHLELRAPTREDDDGESSLFILNKFNALSFITQYPLLVLSVQ